MKNRKIHNPQSEEKNDISTLSWHKCNERQHNANQTNQLHAHCSIKIQTSNKPQ